MTIRNVYLDCEFLPADPSTRGLVSIGLTDDQGVDYYAVNADMDTQELLAISWMVENVWPYLPRIVFGYDEPGRILNHDDPAVQPVQDIRAGVARYFADTDAEETRLYAWYGAQDMCRLHSLWDNDWAVMPDQIPRWFTELEALSVDAGRPELPKQDTGEHHALADARHNRTLHQFLAGCGEQS